MITLYGTGPHFGLPDASPYVTKTEVQLKLLGLPFKKLQAQPSDSPKGQVPFIDDNGERIADSTFIRAYLEQKHKVDLDTGLDARQRAEAWAIERMLENHFGWVMTYTRWIMPDNFAAGPAHFFDQAPEPVREQLRKDVQGRIRDRLFGVGIMRHNEAEILELGVRSLTALSDLLGDRPYLMGRNPTGVDATAFAMLAAILTPFFDSPLRRKAETFTTLVAYVDRMMKRYYPAHTW